MAKNKLTVGAEKLLSAEIGEFFAQATIKKSCEFIGVDPNGLSRMELPAFADHIEKMVTPMRGKDAATSIADRIRVLEF